MTKGSKEEVCWDDVPLMALKCCRRRRARMRVSCLTGNTTSLWGMGQCTKRVVRVESALPVHSAIAEGGLTFNCWTRSCTSV